MIIFLIFILGLFIGSFLNVLIDRLPRRETVLIGRSHCDICGHVLSWFDLIPLVSYFLLLGKCRYCKKNIGFEYPIVEITTAVFFSVAYIFLPYKNPYSLVLPLNLIIISILIIIFFTDLWHGIIPDMAIILLGIISLLNIIIFDKQNVLNALLSALISGGFFLLLFIFTKGKGMGFGDVKLAFAMGFFAFPKILISMYTAFLTASLASLILIILGKKKFHNQTIPFGPFLAIGIYISLYFGDLIWKKYIGIFM